MSGMSAELQTCFTAFYLPDEDARRLLTREGCRLCSFRMHYLTARLVMLDCQLRDSDILTVHNV